MSYISDAFKSERSRTGEENNIIKDEKSRKQANEQTSTTTGRFKATLDKHGFGAAKVTLIATAFPVPFSLYGITKVGVHIYNHLRGKAKTGEDSQSKAKTNEEARGEVGDKFSEEVVQLYAATHSVFARPPSSPPLPQAPPSIPTQTTSQTQPSHQNVQKEEQKLTQEPARPTPSPVSQPKHTKSLTEIYAEKNKTIDNILKEVVMTEQTFNKNLDQILMFAEFVEKNQSKLGIDTETMNGIIEKLDTAKNRSQDLIDAFNNSGKREDKLKIFNSELYTTDYLNSMNEIGNPTFYKQLLEIDKKINNLEKTDTLVSQYEELKKDTFNPLSPEQVFMGIIQRMPRHGLLQRDIQKQIEAKETARREAAQESKIQRNVRRSIVPQTKGTHAVTDFKVGQEKLDRTVANINLDANIEAYDEYCTAGQKIVNFLIQHTPKYKPMLVSKERELEKIITDLQKEFNQLKSRNKDLYIETSVAENINKTRNLLIQRANKLFDECDMVLKFTKKEKALYNEMKADFLLWQETIKDSDIKS